MHLQPPSGLCFGGSSLHLWVAEVEDSDGPSTAPLCQAQYALLSVDERRTLEGFCTRALQRRYLVTRALVRSVLSLYAPVLPRDWAFAPSSHGKPAIRGPSVAASFLRFSISHTKRLVVLLLGCGRDVGVDVEHAGRRAPIQVVSRRFADLEQQHLEGLSPSKRTSRFWDYWTLKESYLKARGLGLSIPLNQFSFDIGEDGCVRFDVDPTLGDHGAGWRFWQFELGGTHRLAVCAERRSDGVSDHLSDPVAWWTVLGNDDDPRPLPLRCLRRSPDAVRC